VAKGVALLVSKSARGGGLGARLVKAQVERAQELGRAAIFATAVMRSEPVQRVFASADYVATALLAGFAPEMVAVGATPPVAVRARGSRLFTIKLLARRPRRVAIPERYAQPIEAAYAALGVDVGGQRGRAGKTRAIEASLDPDMRFARILVGSQSPALLADLERALGELPDAGLEVVYADLDLQRVTEVDRAVDLLTTRGFFYAGLLPELAAGDDLLRLQWLAHPAEAELDRAFTPGCARVLEAVRADRTAQAAA
jgi:hypothetical protein